MEKSIVLFATFKKMQGSIYKVELHRRHRRYEVVCLQVDGMEVRMTLAFDEAHGNALLSSIDYDYQALVDGLHIDNGKLLLRLEGQAL